MRVLHCICSVIEFLQASSTLITILGRIACSSAPMWPIATYVTRSMVCTCVCLCVRHTGVLCKNGGTDPLWGLTHVGTKKHVLHRGQYRTNSFAVKRADIRRCGIVAVLGTT